MPVHSEITGIILRLSNDPDWVFGEEYDFSVYVVSKDRGKTAVLKGHNGNMVVSARLRHEIAVKLIGLGFERISWERFNMRSTEFPLNIFVRSNGTVVSSSKKE